MRSFGIGKSAMIVSLFLVAFGELSYGDMAKYDIKSDSIYNLNSNWISHENKKIQLRTFINHQVLIAMVYTSCEHTCPLIASKMKAIETKSKSSKNLKVVMVSFDPLRDTPVHLKEYFKKMKFGGNWTLLTGEEADIRELAAALGVNYKKDARGEFSHSNIITLLETDGTIKIQMRSLNEDISPLVKLIQ